MVSGKIKITLDAPQVTDRTHCQFTRDGKILANAPALIGNGGDVHFWDIATGQVKATLEGHTPGYAGTSVVYSADSQKLLSAGNDGKIILWDPLSRKRKLLDKKWQTTRTSRNQARKRKWSKKKEEEAGGGTEIVVRREWKN